METIHKIELRFSKAAQITSLFSTVQGDTGTRKIEATILNDDGTVFTPESGTTASYRSRKSDGTGTDHSDGVTMSGNVVTVVLTEQDLAAPGRTYAAIVLEKGGTVLTAMPFWFQNAPIPMGKDIESCNDYQLLKDIIEDAEGIGVNAVKYTNQTLTDAQKLQARTNIGAAEGATLSKLITDLKEGTKATADYHLGFYKDSNGYICQS